MTTELRIYTITLYKSGSQPMHRGSYENGKTGVHFDNVPCGIHRKAP